MAELAALLPEHDLGQRLGNGGFGRVVAAFHRGLDRPDAVKQLAPHWAADPDTRNRFVEEGRLLARLNHPHIVRVFDSVQSAPIYALVMERLDGGTLSERFSRGITPQQSCTVTLAVLAALHEAHRNRVLHRDVKPPNILFTTDGMPKVVDFGIAEILGGNDTLSTPDGRTLCGTPAYMAPEQARGERLGPGTDVYATGVVLYELLTGRPPHPTDPDLRVMLRRRAQEPPQPVGPEVPASVGDAVMRALDVDQRRRYPDAEAFATQLAAAATDAFGPHWLANSGVRVELPRTVEHVIAETGRRASTTVLLPSPAPLRVPPRHDSEMGTLRAQDAAAAQLVRVQDVVAARRPSPLPAVIAAIFALLLALAVAFGPTGEPASPGTDGRDLHLADAAAGGTARTDLSEPVPVSGLGLQSGSYVAQLSVVAGGIELGTATSESFVTSPGQPWNTTVRLDSWTRWVAGGEVRAQLDLLADPGSATVATPPPPVATAEFAVRPVQSAWSSVMGTGAVLLVLIALANVESILVAVRRRGRASVPQRIATGGFGLVFGAAATVATDAFLRHEPSVPAVVVSGLLGAATCVALALAVAARSRPRGRRPVRADGQTGRGMS